MNLCTRYMGLELPHPLIAGASPLSDDLDAVRKLEDAGAAAIVMHSLFEEQLLMEQMASMRDHDAHEESHGEAQSYFPKMDRFSLGPDEYLERLRAIKQTVGIPVFGSLNGYTPGGWLEFAKQIESAGADALELNIYHITTDPDQSAAEVEAQTLRMVQGVRAQISIPLAVKLSPFYSALAHFARQLAQAGADGIVIFNRFYEPDIDPNELAVLRQLTLSDSSTLLMRLRWLAILSEKVDASLAVTGGVHTGLDAVKAVMAGAHAVQMVSALLRHGPGHIGRVRDELSSWLQEHEYDSLEQAQGSMNLLRAPEPHEYERANYVDILRSWEGLS